MKLNERQACQLLGLAAPTTLEAARKAYRKLARQHHPDHGGDEERFKQISVAYNYLVEFYNSSSSTRQASQSSQSSQRTSQSYTQTRDRYTRSSDSKGKSSARSKSSSTRSQQKTSKGYQQEDHRQAWRQWREQVEKNTETSSGSKHSSTQTGSQHSKQQQKTSRQQKANQQQSTRQTQGDDSSQHDESVNPHEVVEASVVPTFGDSVKRWSEEIGDRISVASEHLTHKLNQWYRKSARSLFEKGSDEKLRLDLDLTTLLYGKQVRIAINRALPCSQCQLEHGKLKVDPNTPAALWADDCQYCTQSGRVQQREELSIYVPPGADKGHKLKVNGKGSAGLNGASDGDLTLILTPEALPKGFKRNGADVELHQAVSESLLARGGPLKVQTLRGTISVKVPKNFSSGKKLLIPDQGFPIWNNPEQNGKMTLCLIARS